MNILFLSPAAGADYMCDMLYHGLRSIPGLRVTDVNALTYMQRGADLTPLRGGGYTLYGLLEPDTTVRRDRIRERIRAREFDLVVYGSIQRGSEYLGDVLAAYAPHEIAFVDGEDHQILLNPLLGCGVYFKRELPGWESASAKVKRWVRPITFAIPEEKIAGAELGKSRTMAYIDPRDRGTYIYTNETDYFADYGRSLFGVTMKKAGWDCLRHYEILANGCVPYFLDLQMCPPGTMVHLPKEVLLEVNEAILQNGLKFFATAEGMEVWRGFQAKLQAALRESLTTRRLAEYVLAECAESKRLPAERSRLEKTRSATVVAAMRAISPSGESAWRRAVLNSAYLKLVRGDR